MNIFWTALASKYMFLPMASSSKIIILYIPYRIEVQIIFSTTYRNKLQVTSISVDFRYHNTSTLPMSPHLITLLPRLHASLYTPYSVVSSPPTVAGDARPSPSLTLQPFDYIGSDIFNALKTHLACS